MTPAPATAEKILNAASELFAERGYAATTTRAIAERAGVNEVTLFRRFENKLGILKALVARFAEQSASRQVEQLPHPSDTRGTLLAIARSEVRASIENGGVALRLAFDARSVPEVAELVGEGPRANLEALAAYIADRQEAGDLRDDIPALVLAEAFSSLTSSYVMYRMVMRFVEVEEPEVADATVEQLFDVFWAGASAGGNRDE
jgi:AcrR family transcriptional regulator